MAFTDSFEDLMQIRGVSKSELARKIGTSPAYISQILRGGTDLTLETMVKLVRPNVQAPWKDEGPSPD